MRILPILALCVPLLTSGCFVGDGVAHVVKLANKSSDDNSTPPPAPTPAAAQVPVQSGPAYPSAAPVDRDPAPMPATAPVTDIKVEELPPPKR